MKKVVDATGTEKATKVHRAKCWALTKRPVVPLSTGIDARPATTCGNQGSTQQQSIVTTNCYQEMSVVWHLKHMKDDTTETNKLVCNDQTNR